MDKKALPKELKDGNKRQEVQRRLLDKFGDLGTALEAVCHAEFPKDSELAKKGDGDCKGFRRWITTTGDFFSESGAIVDVREGPPAKNGNFFGMVAAYYGFCGFSQCEEGFQIALAYLIDNGADVQLSDADRKVLDEKRAERKRVEAEKAAKAKKKGISVYQRKMSVEDAHVLYEKYIRGGRGIPFFSAKGLSQHLCAVKNLSYYRKGDDANNGKAFDAILFPYGKQQDGRYNIYGLHAVYLDEKGGIVGKADVGLAKQDLPSWSGERGTTCELSVIGSQHLVIGEGNETVAAFYAAFETSEDYGGQFDFKFTNTASRLKNADVQSYKSVTLLVDRDLSGTGMRVCMEQKFKLEQAGVVVNLLMPPSAKVPIYIYPHKYNAANSMTRCIEQCDYWRRVDALLEEEAKSQGLNYVSRYEAYVVLDESYPKDFKVDYEHVIRVTDIPKDTPKGVDWDNVLEHGPEYAFELFDLFERTQSRSQAA